VQCDETAAAAAAADVLDGRRDAVRPIDSLQRVGNLHEERSELAELPPSEMSIAQLIRQFYSSFVLVIIIRRADGTFISPSEDLRNF